MNSNWIFRLWYIWRLRQQIDSPFKMKNETDAIKTNCIAEIQQAIEPLWLSIKKIIYKLGIKDVQNNRARLSKDEFEKSQISSNPVFSQNEIAKFTKKFWLNVLVIPIFLISESFLYYLVSPLFLPGGNEIMKIAVAIFLALLIMFCIDFGISQHFKYRQANDLYNKKQISTYELKHCKDKRIVGYVLIILSFFAILFAGFARVFFLENIPGTGIDLQKLDAIQHASKWASLLTMVVTFLAAILLAFLKHEQKKVAEKYHVYRYWHSAISKRNDYTQQLIQYANKVLLTPEKYILKYWELTIDLKRMFKMPDEIDEKYLELHQEYISLKAKPSFCLNDSLYKKYSPIQCAHEELFAYGILNHKDIKEKLAEAREILTMPEQYIRQQVEAINQQSQLHIPHVSAENGIQKEQYQETT